MIEQSDSGHVNTSHFIKIKNLDNNEVIKHSILLIRGAVECQTDCTIFENRKIQLIDGERTFFEQVSGDGEFKFLLDLEDHFLSLTEGIQKELNLQFTLCNSKTSLRLFLETPERSFCIQPLYILCRDEEGETEKSKLAKQIIDINLRVVQSLFADRIKEAVGELTTFVVNGNCLVFRSQLTLEEAWKSDENTLWLYFAEELLKGHYFDNDLSTNKKIVAFIGCTKYEGQAVVASNDFSYGNIKAHLKGNAALGGGDLALFGSAFFYAWPSCVEEVVPCLQNEEKINLALEPDESNYRRTRGGVFATTLGAICHEIGHIFDVGHTHDGIMGDGFDYANRVLTLNKRTENLPKRVVDRNTRKQIEHKGVTKITKLNLQRRNDFLDNYRVQKKNDGFYFTKNVAVILAHHPWVRRNKTPSTKNTPPNFTFDSKSGLVVSDKEIIIIEVRSNANSLVEEYFDFSTKNNTEVYEFELPLERLMVLRESHHLFVMTADGHSQRLGLSQS